MCRSPESSVVPILRKRAVVDSLSMLLRSYIITTGKELASLILVRVDFVNISASCNSSVDVCISNLPGGIFAFPQRIALFVFGSFWGGGCVNQMGCYFTSYLSPSSQQLGQLTVGLLRN